MQHFDSDPSTCPDCEEPVPPTLRSVRKSCPNCGCLLDLVAEPVDTVLPLRACIDPVDALVIAMTPQGEYVARHWCNVVTRATPEAAVMALSLLEGLRRG